MTGDEMANNMEKKIADLEMGLMHLQQNIDTIPEITLIIHPLIQLAIKTAEIENSKPRVKDLKNKAHDANGCSHHLENVVNVASR